jgi:hypothetical protein
LTLVATIPAGGQHSVDLGSLDLGPGTRTLYAKAVGKPSILNHLSNAVTYTPAANRFVTITTPTDGSDVLSPVHVAASATSPDTVTLSLAAQLGDERYLGVAELQYATTELLRGQYSRALHWADVAGTRCAGDPVKVSRVCTIRGTRDRRHRSLRRRHRGTREGEAAGSGTRSAAQSHAINPVRSVWSSRDDG